MKLLTLTIAAIAITLTGCAPRTPAPIPAPSVAGVSGHVASASRSVDRADERAAIIERTGAPANAPVTRELRTELAAAQKDLAAARHEAGMLSDELRLFVDGYNQLRVEHRKIERDYGAALASRGRWRGIAFALMGGVVVVGIAGLIVGRFVRFPF